MEVMLYIVSTPIGNLRDFSDRGKETLKNVDIILCEDTRVTRKLLDYINIDKQLISYNDHNALDVIPKVIDSINSKGTRYALVSDAGTPLISDPGYKLINACIKENIKYSVIPGACSVISALVLSGQPSNRFIFDGFAEPKRFSELAKIDATVIMFESSNRLLDTLYEINRYFKGRTISIVREITKIFEEAIRGTYDFLKDHFEKFPPKGEIVIVISPPENDENLELVKLTPLIEGLKDKVSTKDLSAILSKFSGIGKSKIYDFIEEIKND